MTNLSTRILIAGVLFLVVFIITFVIGLISENEFRNGIYDDMFGDNIRNYWAMVVWGSLFLSMILLFASFIVGKYFEEFD